MENGQELSVVWRERLQAQQASGLSIAAWSVYAWRKRLSPAPAAAKLITMRCGCATKTARSTDCSSPFSIGFCQAHLRFFNGHGCVDGKGTPRQDILE